MSSFGGGRLGQSALDVKPGTALYSHESHLMGYVTLVVRLLRVSQFPWRLEARNYGDFSLNAFGILTSGHGWNLHDLVVVKHETGFEFIGKVIFVHTDEIRSMAVIHLQTEFTRFRSLSLFPELFVSPYLPFGPIHSVQETRHLLGRSVGLRVQTPDSNEFTEISGVVVAVNVTSIDQQFEAGWAGTARPPRFRRWRQQLLVDFGDAASRIPRISSGCLLYYRVTNEPIAQLRGMLYESGFRHFGSVLYSFTPLPFLFDGAVEQIGVVWEPLLSGFDDRVGLEMPLNTSS